MAKLGVNMRLPLTQTLVELISDDFGSTFSLVNENTLANLLSPYDFEDVKRAIDNQIDGNLTIQFTLQEKVGEDMGIYLIRIIE
jgi:hypothetical protein